MKKIILALLLLLAPSLAHANTPVLRCTTAAWDGFVDLKTLPDSNSYILTQLSNWCVCCSLGRISQCRRYTMGVCLGRTQQLLGLVTPIFAQLFLRSKVKC
jgi:hypothetical protein